MSGGWNLLNFFTNANTSASMGTQTPTTPWTGIDGAAQFVPPQRLRDVVGKLKISQSQNIYDADFEYGVQPLRWENYINNVSGSASIVQAPGLGGVTMTIGNSGATTPGDITIRQSRPYHRYQPGKTMYMASNVNFGASIQGQFQRVGIFDDSNGIFFQQSGSGTTANPYAMYIGVRSDSGGMPVDTLVSADGWNGNQSLIKSIDWTKVQMIWMEYAWYGAGALRWGVVINGEPWICHQIGTGNSSYSGTAQTKPWSRTGNLPVRYEQRDTGTGGLSVMTHYGVSVLIEGGIDKQRGFTYSYGMSPASPTRLIGGSGSNAFPVVRFPLLSFRMRPMGQVSQDQSYNYNGAGVPSAAANNAFSAGTTTTLTTTGASMTAGSYVGRSIYYQAVPGGTTSNTITAAVVSNASATGVISGTTLTISGSVTNTFYVGMTLTSSGTITANTIITGQISGVPGGAGQYSVSISQNQTSATITGSGAAVLLTFQQNHNLLASGPTTTASQAGDVLALSGFTSSSTVPINGVFPVVAVPTAKTAVINVGYGVTSAQIGTITVGTVNAAYTARISANTTTAVTFQDVVTGGAMPNAPTGNYSIGLIDRGQLLPQTMLISSDKTCIVELIASTPTAEVGLNGANFQALAGLGSFNSFAERDVQATSLSGGEVVYAFPLSPTGGLQQIDLSFFFPVLTSIKGNLPDILTVAITTPASSFANVSANVICAEAMS
jgi:hypothetical protein